MSLWVKSKTAKKSHCVVFVSPVDRSRIQAIGADMKKEGKSLTLRQIAKLARTSKSTVSRVLTNHPSVSPRTRERIETVIDKHGFRPNLFARGLAGGRTGLIAVLASQINSGFYAEVMKGIDEAANLQRGHLLSSFAHDQDDFIRLWLEFAEGGRADGVILIAPPLALMEQMVKPEHVPSILCACTAPKANKKGWTQVDSVVLDNRKAFEQILRHLLSRGCRHLVHMAGPSDIYDSHDRRQAFEEFVTASKVVKGDVVEAGLSEEDGHTAVLRYLDFNPKLPDAFVAFNDATAIGILGGLRERGYSVPQDVALTGCDDEPPARFVGLTTLHMPMVDLGRETARLLFDRLAHRGDPLPPRQSVVEMTLTVRSTSLTEKTPPS